MTGKVARPTTMVSRAYSDKKTKTRERWDQQQWQAVPGGEAGELEAGPATMTSRADEAKE